MIHNPKRKLNLLRLYCFLTTLEGIFTITWLLTIPSEGSKEIAFGLSIQRLIILTIPLIVTLFCAYTLFSSWLQKANEGAILRFASQFTKRGTLKSIILILSFFTFILGLQFVLLTPEIQEPFTFSYFVRLRPIASLLAAIGAQNIFFLSLNSKFADKKATPEKKSIIKSAIFFFIIFLILWGIIAYTHIGLIASDIGAGWYALGNPILGWQALLAWIITVGVFGLFSYIRNSPTIFRKFPAHIDLVISILLWTFAFVFWMSIPLSPNWFAAPPRPPNYAFYPNSDASIYDTTAQSALVGEGFQTKGAPFAIRPMYALMLAIFHGFGGLGYESIIWIQVAFIAILPVLIYWLTKRYHNRYSGLFVSILIIFREANAIKLGGDITNSHAKLLMSDLPTTIGVVAFLLLITIWLQDHNKSKHLPLIAGGVLGFTVLIRPEFLVLLVPVAFVAFLQRKINKKGWLQGLGVVIAGLVLMLAPWIWRNYQLTGTIFLDSPHYRADLFAQRYRDLKSPTENNPLNHFQPTPHPTANNLSQTPQPQNQEKTTQPTIEPTSTASSTIDIQPGESFAHFTVRLFHNVSNYIKQNPGKVIHFILNHFANSEIQTVLYLPLTNRFFDSTIALFAHHDLSRFFDECCSAHNYIQRLPFWHKWNGKLPTQSLVPLILNLAFISLGLGIVWREQRWLGLLPVFASISHYLINAIVRNSGGRYILAVDWIGAFYLGIGIMQVTSWTFNSLLRREFPATDSIANEEIAASKASSKFKNNTTRYILISIAMLLVGCALPVMDKAIPKRYTQTLLNNHLQNLDDELDGELAPSDIANIHQFLENKQATAYLGRALYPRFHHAGEGEVGSTWKSFYPKPYPRISFYAVGQKNTGVVLPYETVPSYLPHGADVLFIGCPENANNFNALLVIVYDANGNITASYFRTPSQELICAP